MAKGRKKAVKITELSPTKGKEEQLIPCEVPHRYSVRATAGQPPFYETPEALSSAVDAYFKYCEGEFHMEKRLVEKKARRGQDEDEEPEEEEVKVWDRYPEPHTVTGLVLFLGFSHRQSLSDYEEKDQYSDIIKRARSRIEHGYEKRLFHDRPVGAIFALTNMGWKNQQQVDHTSKGEKIGDKPDLSKLTDDELVQYAALNAKLRGE